MAWPGIRRETKMKTKILTAFFMVAPVVLMGAAGSATAADKWFVMGEQTIKTADPSTNITSQGNRWEKDVKWVKLSAEGADVEIRKVVLHWDNRRDEAISDLGVLKSGGQTAAKEAPGRKGRLTAVTVNYKILNDAKTANLKVWGFD